MVSATVCLSTRNMAIVCPSRNYQKIRGFCSVADTGAIQQRSMANSCQKGWNGSTGNHKVTQDLTTKSTHGTRQLKRCCFHRIAEGSRPREVWADTSATARRYLGEWTNGKDQFCCTDPKFFLVHELSSQQFKAGLSSKKNMQISWQTSLWLSSSV